MSGYNLTSNAQSSKVLYLNSRDADVYIEKNNFGDFLHTNFLYTLTEKLNISSSQFALLSLYSATIPHSFFNVRDGVNDTIPLKIEWETYNTPPSIHTQEYEIKLDDGNYDTTQLIRQFIYGNTSQVAGQGSFQDNIYIGYNDLEFTAGTSGGVSLVGKKISSVAELSIFYNQVNNCFRFQLDNKNNTLVNYVKITFDFASAPIIGSATTGSTDRLANALFGFSGLVDYPNAVAQVNPAGSFAVGQTRVPPTTTFSERAVLQSQQVIDLNDNIHGLMLRTNLVSKGTMSSNSAVFSNILARIPITSLENGRGTDNGVAQQGGMIYFNPSNATHQNLVDLDAIDILGVRLTDDKDRTIDLNGLDFQIAILIQFVDKMESQLAPQRPLFAPIPQPIQEPIKNKSPKKSSTKK